MVSAFGIFAYVRKSIDPGNLSKDRVVRTRSAPDEKNEAEHHTQCDSWQDSDCCNTQGRDEGKRKFRPANITYLPHSLKVEKRCTSQDQHST